jgi:hypothetical protein
MPRAATKSRSVTLAEDPSEPAALLAPERGCGCGRLPL